MRRFCLVLVMAVCLAFGLVACGGGDDSLSVPSGISLTGASLTWEEVDGAIQYSVQINNASTPKKVKVASISLADLPCETDFTVRVMALGDGVNSSDSDWSDEQTFTATSAGFAHSYGAWSDYQPASCTEGGISRRTCVRCSDYQDLELEPLGHDFAWVETLAAGETEDGEETQFCTRCQLEGETQVAHAHGTEGLIFTLNSAGTGYRVSGGGSMSAAAAKSTVYVPSYHNRLPVLEVGGAAFNNFKNLEKIIIPNMVTNIGSMIFNGCDNLKEIVMPFVGASREATGREAILGYSFLETTSANEQATRQYFGEAQPRYYIIPNSLVKVTITDAKTLGYGAFNGCNMLLDVTATLSAGVDDTAFKDCSKLKSVTILGEGVRIGKNAFENCTSLTDVSLSDSIVSVEQAAFKGCSALQKMRLPTSLVILGSEAFANCTKLAWVSMPTSLNIIGRSADGSELDESGTRGNTFLNCSSLKWLAIPKSVQVVGLATFSGCNMTLYVESGIAVSAFEKISWNNGNGVKARINTATLAVRNGETYVESVNKNGNWLTNYDVGLTLNDPSDPLFSFLGWRKSTGGETLSTTLQLNSATNGIYNSLWA